MENLNKIIKTKLAMAQSANSLRDIFDVIHADLGKVFCEVTNGFSISKTTYGQAKQYSFAAYDLVAEHHIEKGSYVGLYGENSATWIYMFWAILMAGCRPLLLNTRFPDFVNKELIERMNIKKVFALGEHGDLGCEVVLVKEKSLALVREPKNPPTWSNHFALSTSATTSFPNVCVYDGESIIQQILNSEWVLKRSKLIKKHYEGSLKVLAFLPFYHVFGFFVVYFWFCYFSRTAVFLKDMQPDTILRTVRKHKVTHIFGVPLLWHEIYKEVAANVAMKGASLQKKFDKGVRLSIKLQSICRPLGMLFAKKAFRQVRERLFGDSVSFMISGGGSIYSEAIKTINALGYPLHNGYGMTEIGITSVELSKNARTRCNCSIGKPFGKIEYSVDENGLLGVRARSFAIEIIGMNGKQSLPRGKVFATSDIVRSDKNGSFYVLGRKDDVIITIGGEKINPDTVESCLFFSYIEKFCVIGLSDGKGTQDLCLIVKFRPDESALRTLKAIEELDRALNRLSHQGIVFSKVYATTDALCSANAIKVSRAHLKKYIDNGQVRLQPYSEFKKSCSETPQEIDADTKQRLKQIFGAIARRNPEEIGVDQHFIFDLGCNSLNYFVLLTELKRVFCINFDFSSNQRCYSVASFAEYINSQYEFLQQNREPENNKDEENK